VATGAAEPARRVAAVGMSLGATSGMRDHARLLAQELTAQGTPCSLHWLARSEDQGLTAARAETRRWARALADQLREQRPDAIVLHYASFAYAHRGVPLLLGPTLAAIRRSGAPVIALMHELAYPWRGGARGALWAASQRAALVPLVRSSSAVIVTTEQRSQWLASRRWLPRRAIAVAPVFSNLPPPHPQVAVDDSLVGLFGYAYEGAAVAIVLDALTELRGHAGAVVLELLGAPGPETEVGREWRHGARQRGVADALRFSGRLPAQELSDALARCAALICAASPGPTSRKGTLAAELASGRPVVALDGHLTWSELVEQDAARVVAANPAALAGELARLLSDTGARDALGARGREFHERRMAVARTAELVISLIGR
jgi:glycosyltransferase involved in cell wall biosynthesis